MPSPTRAAKIVIFVEDTYGAPFFKKLITQLKENAFIPSNIEFEVKHSTMPCNHKTIKLAVARFTPLESKATNVILVFDGDGRQKEKLEREKNKIHTHYPDYVEKIHILVFKYEIEELLFWSSNKRIPNNPSKYLKTHEKYSKRDLPKLLNRVDLVALSKHEVIDAIINISKQLVA